METNQTRPLIDSAGKINLVSKLNLLIILTSLFAIPISLGFGFFDSFLFSILLLANVFSGAYLFFLLSTKDEFLDIELFGIGIGLGTLTPAVINFCARMLGFSIKSTAFIFPFIMILVFLIKRLRRKSLVRKVLSSNPIDFVLILSTPFFALSAWTDSLTFFCIFLASALLVIIFLEGSVLRSLNLQRITQFLTLLIIPLSSILFRFVFTNEDSTPVWRLFVGVDVAFDEATAFGTAKYGIFDNALLAGQMNEGHTLTHSWAGDFASLLELPPFMITASVGFVVGVLGVAAMIYSTSIYLFRSRIAARIALVVAFVQASMPEEYLFVDTIRMAHSMSIMWMMLFCCLVITIFDGTLRYPDFWVFFLVFGVTYSKVHWGVLATLIIIILLVLNPKDLINLRLVGIAVPTFLASTYLSFPNGKGFPINIGFTPSFYLEMLSIIALRMLLSVGVFRSAANGLANKIGFIVVLFAIVAHSVLAGEYASNYWISFALLWAAIFSGKLISQSFVLQHSFLTARFLHLLSISMGAFACYLFFTKNYLLISTNQSSLQSWFIVSYPELIPIVVVIVACCVGFLMLGLTSPVFRSTGFLKYHLSLVVTTAFFVNIGFWIVQNQRTNILESRYDIELTSDLVLRDTQIEMAYWLTSNTDQNSILATNFLCDLPIKQGEPFPNNRIGGCFERNTLTWLASIGHRRVLIESPIYSGSYVGSKLQIRDYNSSILFGRDMNSISAGYLATRGVDYFVFDKATSKIHGLQDFGNVLYQNLDYAVIALSDVFD
jgi:hypothetical protein